MANDDGIRESEQSWTELLVRVRERQNLAEAPRLAIGDGGLGFWKALTKVFGETRHPRCWVHKTANVLNKLPKSLQKKAKGDLHAIWMAPTKAEAERAFDAFLAAYGAKYPKATDCLAKDRQQLLSFYDFPAVHWTAIRTINPIESTFATVRLRTDKTRGCVSRTTILALVFKLGQSAQTRWKRLRGFRLLPKVYQGTRFKDGEEVTQEEENSRNAA